MSDMRFNSCCLGCPGARGSYVDSRLAEVQSGLPPSPGQDDQLAAVASYKLPAQEKGGSGWPASREPALIFTLMKQPPCALQPPFDEMAGWPSTTEHLASQKCLSCPLATAPAWFARGGGGMPGATAGGTAVHLAASSFVLLRSCTETWSPPTFSSAQTTWWSCVILGLHAHCTLKRRQTTQLTWSRGGTGAQSLPSCYQPSNPYKTCRGVPLTRTSPQTWGGSVCWLDSELGSQVALLIRQSAVSSQKRIWRRRETSAALLFVQAARGAGEWWVWPKDRRVGHRWVAYWAVCSIGVKRTGCKLVLLHIWEATTSMPWDPRGGHSFPSACQGRWAVRSYDLVWFSPLDNQELALQMVTWLCRWQCMQPGMMGVCVC